MSKIYDEIFENAEGIKIIKSDAQHRTVWWRYTILIDQKINLQTFKEKALKKILLLEKAIYLCTNILFLKNIITFHYQMQKNLEKKL